MRFKRRKIGGLAVVGLIAVSAVTVVTEAETAAAFAGGAGQPGTRTITLVTGDRVVTGDGGRVLSVEAGPGRAGVTFTMTTLKGHIRVVPSDAVPLLAADRLDPRLFDVNMLTDLGYHQPDQLPLIVVGNEVGSTTALRDSIGGGDDLVKVRDLPAVNGLALRQVHGKSSASWQALTTGGAIAHNLRSGVKKVWLDGLRQPVLDVSVPQVGAPAAWAAGFTGEGSKVAVLDTGIDDTHPDLAGQVVARQNFTEGTEADDDLSGHGTHVASITAGTGAASHGRFKGVAPAAKLLDGKVCAVFGCAESWIIAGMTWAAAEQDARVVNMSLGGQDDPDVEDPVEQAVRTLSEQHGTLFVIAAGNSDGGVIEGEIASPGTADAALTVGAVDSDDEIADFSRRGPRAPDGGLKPDITAPGVDITAARSKAAIDVPGGQGDRYTTLSGTSMATPHVAGAAAILAQEHPRWTGQRLKAALTASAQPNTSVGVFAQGAGRVDVAKAVAQSVTTEPVSISFGEQVWPHPDDPILTRTVSYQNAGSAAVTLALRVDAFVPGGAPAPGGMFTISATSVQVPADGQVTVTVTADTRSGPDGFIGGWLTATSGSLVVRTPVGVNKEIESYDVTVTQLDRAGSAPSSMVTMFAQHGSDGLPTVSFGGAPDNTETFRLPKGHYSLVGTQALGADPKEVKAPPDDAGESTTLIAQPDLDVNQPLEVTLDARQAKPLSVTLPNSSAQQFYAQMGASLQRPSGSSSLTVLGETFSSFYSARIGADLSDGTFGSGVAGQWAQPGPDGSLLDSPKVYALQFNEPGRMISGYQRTVRNDELARVNVCIAAEAPGTTGRKDIQTFIGEAGTASVGLDFHLPFSRTEYYNKGIGAWGQLTTHSETGEDLTYQSGFQLEYRPGNKYREQWNRGVFAPGVPTPTWEGTTRTGDQITIDTPIYSDGLGRAGDTTDVRTTTLFRDSTKIAESDLHRFITLGVSAATARYRLEVHAERPAPAVLSTTTDVAWTFSSGHVASDIPVTLPLWTLRFKPNLDRNNTAPANENFAVPVEAVAPTGAATGHLTNLTIEASFDDGQNWTDIRVTSGSAQVPHPNGTGFVSLRAKATDSVGNTLQETIIHAYRYGPTS